MKFKILTFLITLALGILAWFPFKPAPRVLRHSLALSALPLSPLPAHVDFHGLYGEINGEPASIHFSRDGNWLFGYYSVRDSQNSIPIRGAIDNDNCIVLVEYADDAKTPTGWFRGELLQGDDFRLSLAGSWSRSGDGKDSGTFHFEEARFPPY
jgi:hypothetical protein